MSKLAQLFLLVVTVAVTTASMPFIPPVQPVMTLVPVAIIEGGTVATLPKSVKARGGRVVVVRGRADKPVRAANNVAAVVTRRPVRDRAAEGESAVASAGGSSADVVEMRNTDNALRVMILGPDGLTRTRYVPAAPGLTTRPGQDD